MAERFFGGHDLLAIAQEMKRLDDEAPLIIKIKAQDAFALIASLQMAWRHPGLSAQQKQLIEDFARQFEGAFAQAPNTARAIAEGWRRDKDIPVADAGADAEPARVERSLVHLADWCKESVQRCQRCGCVLVDLRDSLTEGGGPVGVWGPGDEVVVRSGRSGLRRYWNGPVEECAAPIPPREVARA